MPETDPVVTKLLLDIDDYNVSVQEAKRGMDDLSGSVDNSHRRMAVLSSRGKDVVFTMLAIRGAFNLTNMVLKEFGIENENLVKTLKYMEIATYAVIVASKIYALAKGNEARANIFAAVTEWIHAHAKVAGATLFIGLAASIAAMTAAIAITYASMPKAQFGGIVRPRPGGTPVIIGEAGRAEAIVPLGNKGAIGGGDINIHIEHLETNDSDAFVRMLGRKIQILKSAGY